MKQILLSILLFFSVLPVLGQYGMNQVGIIGTIEAGVKAITDITEPVIMLYDLAVDKKARTEAYNGLIQIKDQVKDDLSSLFPLLGEIILEEFSGNTSEEWQEANSDQTDNGRQSHLLTKGTVRTVASVFASGKFLTKVPDMADDLAKKMAKISDKTVADYTEDLAKFVKKSLPQKLEEIKNIWETKYPIMEMLEGRTFFEDIMGEYRYTKASGWEHTADISPNFKGVDFYKGVIRGKRIYAETAVSMKTTITKDVNTWLKSEPIQKNIEFLTDGLDQIKGMVSNNKTMFITNAEIHIYMPKENITDALKIDWLNKLNTTNPKIKFEIKSLEDYIK
jgi:hypothetical protein